MHRIDAILHELIEIHRSRESLPRDAYATRVQLASRRLDLHAEAASLAHHRIG